MIYFDEPKDIKRGLQGDSQYDRNCDAENAPGVALAEGDEVIELFLESNEFDYKEEGEADSAADLVDGPEVARRRECPHSVRVVGQVGGHRDYHVDFEEAVKADYEHNPQLPVQLMHHPLSCKVLIDEHGDLLDSSASLISQ